MVQTQKKAVVVSQALVTLARYTTCRLSKEPLALPVVGCVLGNLYNKSAIIELLLGQREDPENNCIHITSLSMVTVLNLTQEIVQNESTIVGNFKETSVLSRFCCPITRKQMNGNLRFVFLTCGCVVAESVTLEMKDLKECVVCSKKITGVATLINPVFPLDLENAKNNLADQIMTRKAGKKGKAAKVTSGVSKKRVTVELLPTINMKLPNMESVEKAVRLENATISAMYYKKDAMGHAIEKKNNWLSKGTHNRYSAC